jgi:hypothetical protein
MGLTGCSPPEDERSHSNLLFQNRQPESPGGLPSETRHALKNEPASKSYLTRGSRISRKFESLKIWICEMKGKSGNSVKRKWRAKVLGWIRYGQVKATDKTILPRWIRRRVIDRSRYYTLDPKLKIHQSKDQSIIPKFSQV